jgi:two-component system alkaline phosphatase synthesis response regulator PhoP
MQRILIVDIHRTDLSQLSTQFEKAGYDVQITHDRETAFQILQRRCPDLLIICLYQPDHTDWELIRSIQHDPTLVFIPMIMIAPFANDDDQIFGLEIGVDDFIIRPNSPRVIIARAKALLRLCNNQNTDEQSVLQIGKLTLDLNCHELLVDGKRVYLTQSEFRIIRILMGNPGYVFTRTELVIKALGGNQEGVGRSLDTHIKNLRRKIEPNPQKPVIIQTVFGVGYKMIMAKWV